MIIDFHTHAFPQRIAERAIDKLSFTSGGLAPQTNGSAESLKEEMKKDGVDISVVLSIATNPAQQNNVNNFAAELNGDASLYAFGSVHPDAPDALSELERIKSLGLKGVKFHPEYQKFYVDAEKMKPIYKKISSLGLITVFHAGYDYGYAPPYHCMPENMARALKWFDSPVIAAHWGGVNSGMQVLKHLAGLPIWFDVSFGYAAIPRGIALMITEKHTPDKMLFGSDMPWHRPSWEMRLINTLGLSDSEKDKIYFKNAAKLLSIGGDCNAAE